MCTHTAVLPVRGYGVRGYGHTQLYPYTGFGEETPQERLDLTSVKEYLKYFGVRV